MFIGQLAKTDELTGERGSHVDGFAFTRQVDVSMCVDPSNQIMERIFEVSGNLGQLSLRRLIQARWASHVERLVGALLVEDALETVEALLLLQRVASSRTCCLSFERQVKSLVLAILLGMARLNSLQFDAQLY